MPKAVVIDLGTGDLHSGLPRVTAQVWVGDRARPEQYVGSLPAAPAILDLYRDWSLLYRSLCERRSLRSVMGIRSARGNAQEDDLEIDELGITNVSQLSFEELCQNLQDALNTWLQAETFLPIERQLRSQLSPVEEIHVAIATDDPLLRQLPWHRWEFFKDYPRAEMALSCSTYQLHQSASRMPHPKARVLAILGNSQGINLEQDAQFLQHLPDAETQLLVNPTRYELNQQLWDKRGWDVLFFAGHSRTEAQQDRQTGRIYINENLPHNSLTIEQLEAAIEGAVSNGLKLAIFNSCDGLGLATALGGLHIPQVIVMREPVPNQVAQEFFKHFLTAFAEQRQSLYLAMRQARQQLQGLEDEFPGASWLPVLCQNPAVESPTWQDWCNPLQPSPQPLRLYRSLQTVLLTSLVVTTLVAGARYLGGLQPWELRAFDHLLRLRPPEPPDHRILIVTVTEEDLHLPEQADRKGSLSDVALAKLLQNLSPLNPRAIGLDIYRDFPFDVASNPSATALKNQPNFFAICKVADQASDSPEIAPMPDLPDDRQGFSDVVVDRDNVLRRHLLFMDRAPGASCNTPYALSTRLAFKYLEAEGIAPAFTPEGALQLGEHTFQRLHRHRGGYHRHDTAGYQILLNYRFTQPSQSPSPTITLQDALSGRLKAEDVRDRVVLIGVTAPSSKDFHITPYGERIPGVFIQAQMVSQLISAVKDGRTPIQVWPWQIETFWIWSWSIAGGILAWRCRSLPWLLGLEVIALGSLGLLSFYGLTQSQWVPLVPPALAFVLTNGSVAVMVANQDDKNSFSPLIKP